MFKASTISHSISRKHRLGKARLAALCVSIAGAGTARAAYLIDPTGGTKLTVSGDDATVADSIGLSSFQLFGVATNNVFVCTNGFISTTSSTAYNNQPLTSTGISGKLIAPLWDDLQVYAADSITQLTNPGVYSAFTWQVSKTGTVGTKQNFQAVLFGATDTVGLFTFQPNDIAFSYATLTDSLAGGNGTVGLANGTTGALYSSLPGTSNGVITSTSSLPTGAGQFVLFRPDSNGDGGYTSSIQSTQVPAGSIYFYTGTGSPAATFDTTSQNFTLNGSPAAFSNGSTGSTVIFDDSATGSHTVNVPAGVNPAVVQFNNSSSSYTLSGAGGIIGPALVAISGGGNVTFSNSNAYTGITAISLGTLTLNPSASIAGSSVTVGAGGALRLNGSGFSLAGLSGAGPVTYVSGNGVNLTLTGSGSYSGSLTLGLGSLTVNESSPATQTLSGANSYSGGTVLSSGAVLIGTSSALGSGNISLQGGSLGATTAGVNLSNKLTGSALVLPAGSGVLELSNTANTFAGPVVIQASASLQLDSPGAIGGLNGGSPGTGMIIVASGASLIVNDNSATLGRTGGSVSGTPISLQLSGTGFGGNGALRGPDNTSATWAGSISLSGPAAISPGYNSMLTLSGAITGSGPLLLGTSTNASSGTSNLLIAPPSATSNNYTGETQILSGPSGVSSTVTLGAANGFSPASGLNFANASGGATTVDLHGFNQSVAYLTGAANSNTILTNSNASTLSTLTINNGSNGTAPQNFASQISGNIYLVKTGTGNQTLGGSNTYTGGTKVTQGTLTASSSASFGSTSSTITLNGGILALGGATPVAIPVLTGFGSFAAGNGQLLNTGQPNPPTTDGSTLILTNNTQHANASIFTANPVALNLTNGFTVSYLYTPNDPSNPSSYTADGLAFVLQNDPRGTAALGDGGGSKGYGGNSAIQNSFAAFLDIYAFDGNSDVGFGTNGSVQTPNNTYPLVIRNQADQVVMSYNASSHMISETITSATNSSQSYSTTYAVDLGSVLGSSSAYVGFTGGEGDGSAQQLVQNFSFSNLANGPVGLTQPIVAAAGTTSIIQVAVATGANTESIASLTLNSGSTVTLTTASGSVGRVVLSTPSLTISSASGSYTGKFDLGSNDLDLPGASITTVTKMVAQAYTRGAWTGNGIASNAAGSDSSHLTALGVAINDTGANNGAATGTPLYTTLDGSPVTTGDILVKYTYYGDANLDGAVDGSDYSLIDNGFLAHLTGWYNGDFNYDNTVDGSDYTLIDNAFNAQGASLGSNPLAQISAQIAGGTAVPEPVTLGTLAMIGAGLLGRHRRKI